MITYNVIHNGKNLYGSLDLEASKRFHFEGKIDEGWYTLAQVDARQLEYTEVRTVVDCEAKEVIIEEDQIEELDDDIEVLNRQIVVGQETDDEGNEIDVFETQFYLILPEINHTEFFVLANYSIIEEDSDSPEYKLAHYAELRRAAYLPLAEQLDLQFKSFDLWKAHIQSVKSMFPKP